MKNILVENNINSLTILFTKKTKIILLKWRFFAKYLLFISATQIDSDISTKNRPCFKWSTRIVEEVWWYVYIYIWIENRGGFRVLARGMLGIERGRGCAGTTLETAPDRKKGLKWFLIYYLEWSWCSLSIYVEIRI